MANRPTLLMKALVLAMNGSLTPSPSPACWGGELRESLCDFHVKET